MNYYDNFNGDADASTLPLTSGQTKRLPDHVCKFVLLAYWNTTDNEAFTARVGAGTAPEDSAIECYYGFNGILVGTLFPGRETQLLPINNTNQIIVRAPKAAAVVRFAWFK